MVSPPFDADATITAALQDRNVLGTLGELQLVQVKVALDNKITANPSRELVTLSGEVQRIVRKPGSGIGNIFKSPLPDREFLTQVRDEAISMIANTPWQNSTVSRLIDNALATCDRNDASLQGLIKDLEDLKAMNEQRAPATPRPAIKSGSSSPVAPTPRPLQEMQLIQRLESMVPSEAGRRPDLSTPEQRKRYTNFLVEAVKNEMEYAEKPFEGQLNPRPPLVEHFLNGATNDESTLSAMDSYIKSTKIDGIVRGLEREARVGERNRSELHSMKSIDDYIQQLMSTIAQQRQKTK